MSFSCAVTGACQCGKVVKRTSCASQVFSCDTPCGSTLACGNHTCPLVCHAGSCPPCPRTGMRQCPCGKAEFKGLPCTTATPTCGDTCEKRLACGVHACPRTCHVGECGPCVARLVTSCRCGRSVKDGLCSGVEVLCNNRCTEVRDCGRHACKRRCCQGKAGVGDASCPPCRELCGSKLSCETHFCNAFCHKGPCLPCPLTSVVSCACGATKVIVPCGKAKSTPIPQCKRLCALPPSCHHTKPIPHGCHTGACPPCTLRCGVVRPRCGHACPRPCHDNAAPALTAAAVKPDAACGSCLELVERMCVGGHSVKVQPCSAPSLFRCDAKCGALLPCTKHRCEKSCHAGAASGSSGIGGEDKGACGSCTAVCSEPRPSSCTHNCVSAHCHPGACAPCLQPLTRRCYCSSETASIACSLVDPSERAMIADGCITYSCAQKCRQPRALCSHLCSGVCHPNACDTAFPCTKSVSVRCRCGCLKEEWPCSRAQVARSTHRCAREELRLLECSDACVAAASTTSSGAGMDDAVDNGGTSGTVMPEQESKVSVAERAELRRRRKAEEVSRLLEQRDAEARRRDEQAHLHRQLRRAGLALATFLLALLMAYLAYHAFK